ncbi:MAG: hypothetical protein WBG86_20620 [Polyangiales bacterium]
MPNFKLRKIEGIEIHDWAGAEYFDDRADGDDTPVIGEHPAGFSIVGSEGVVGVYPEADPNTGFWLANDVAGYDAVIALCEAVGASDCSPKALRALGFVPEEEVV